MMGRIHLYKDTCQTPAVHLKKQQEVIPGLYGEIFLTNIYGELIASTTKLTTHYHGDKYWWLEAYNEGEGKVFFDDRGLR